ncbi:hypothetical protein [Alkalicoccus chagannorensis]|uniref:hypothetical protein n=1 Tax=Alkalicoccus chagannorensis TaxID=427072 RepID=UPI00041108DC|nr:hypothetical protein [Alkalicoccus chagannorensis]
MWKLMLISTLFTAVLITGGMLLWLQETTGGVFDQEEEENRTGVSTSFEDDSYYYFLDHEEVTYLIERGRETVDGYESYMLPVEFDGLSSTVAFAYVEPPSLTVVKESRRIQDHYQRTPSVEELQGMLMDRFLPIHLRFHENRAFVHEAELESETGRIQPVETDISGGGSMQTMYFSVEDLPFEEEEISLVVEDELSDDFMRYTLRFADYQRERDDSR